MILFDRNNAPMWVDATDADIARATGPRRIMAHPLAVAAALAAGAIIAAVLA